MMIVVRNVDISRVNSSIKQQSIRPAYHHGSCCHDHTVPSKFMQKDTVSYIPYASYIFPQSYIKIEISELDSTSPS